jgi:hypothetical protein
VLRVSAGSTVEQNIERKLDQARARPPSYSLFRDNALQLVTQATSYAQSFQVKYVAVFDWQYLVLLNYDLSRGGISADVVEGTMVSDFASPNNARPMVRKALLGFLLGALATLGML